MLLYIITVFIFRFVSYKKIKKDLFNMSIILDKISRIKIEEEIKDNENSMENIVKKSKSKRRIKRKINKINSNKKNKDNIININIKNNDKRKYSKNIRETIQDKKDKLTSNQNIIKILKFKSYDINLKNIKEILEIKDFEKNSL